MSEVITNEAAYWIPRCTLRIQKITNSSYISYSNWTLDGYWSLIFLYYWIQAVRVQLIQSEIN